MIGTLPQSYGVNMEELFKSSDLLRLAGAKE